MSEFTFGGLFRPASPRNDVAYLSEGCASSGSTEMWDCTEASCSSGPASIGSVPPRGRALSHRLGGGDAASAAASGRGPGLVPAPRPAGVPRPVGAPRAGAAPRAAPGPRAAPAPRAGAARIPRPARALPRARSPSPARAPPRARSPSPERDVRPPRLAPVRGPVPELDAIIVRALQNDAVKQNPDGTFTAQVYNYGCRHRKVSVSPLPCLELAVLFHDALRRELDFEVAQCFFPRPVPTEDPCACVERVVEVPVVDAPPERIVLRVAANWARHLATRYGDGLGSGAEFDEEARKAYFGFTSRDGLCSVENLLLNERCYLGRYSSPHLAAVLADWARSLDQAMRRRGVNFSPPIDVHTPSFLVYGKGLPTRRVCRLPADWAVQATLRLGRVVPDTTTREVFLHRRQFTNTRYLGVQRQGDACRVVLRRQGPVGRGHAFRFASPELAALFYDAAMDLADPAGRTAVDRPALRNFNPALEPCATSIELSAHLDGPDAPAVPLRVPGDWASQLALRVRRTVLDDARFWSDEDGDVAHAAQVAASADPRASQRGLSPGTPASQPDPLGSQPDPRGSQPIPQGSQPDPRGSQPDPLSSQPDQPSSQSDLQRADGASREAGSDRAARADAAGELGAKKYRFVSASRDNVFEVKFMHNGRHLSCGVFASPVLAALVADSWKRRLSPDFLAFNFRGLTLRPFASNVRVNISATQKEIGTRPYLMLPANWAAQMSNFLGRVVPDTTSREMHLLGKKHTNTGYVGVRRIKETGLFRAMYKRNGMGQNEIVGDFASVELAALFADARRQQIQGSTDLPMNFLPALEPCGTWLEHEMLQPVLRGPTSVLRVPTDWARQLSAREGRTVLDDDRGVRPAGSPPEPAEPRTRLPSGGDTTPRKRRRTVAAAPAAAAPPAAPPTAAPLAARAVARDLFPICEDEEQRPESLSFAPVQRTENETPNLERARVRSAASIASVKGPRAAVSPDASTPRRGARDPFSAAGPAGVPTPDGSAAAPRAGAPTPERGPRPLRAGDGADRPPTGDERAAGASVAGSNRNASPSPAAQSPTQGGRETGAFGRCFRTLTQLTQELTSIADILRKGGAGHAARAP